MPVTALDTNTALVAIDLQRGLAARPLARPFAEIVAHTVRLAKAFRAAKLPVVLVHVAFGPDGGDMVRTRVEAAPRLPPNLGPEFFELVPELGAEPSDIIVTKRQPNAFYGTDLDLQLRRRKVTGIVLTGVATTIGVDSTARAAHERAYNVTFASDAITDMEGASHDFAMAKSFPRLGESGTTDDILAMLQRR
jgi:nicotinamidase-related amidase